MIIKAQAVSKQFGSFTAVDAASFAVKKGEVVGFVGANGAGKSTTINMLLGFIKPSSGSITLFNQPLQPASAHIQHSWIGYAAGDMELPLTLTGEQYLAFVTAQHGRTFEKRQAELVDIFAPQLHKKIGTLSRGNKQKIALVAAFLPEPKLVILDEPTSGLDPIMQEKFLHLVRREQARGVTVFMSSHYLTEVADVCSRVILMRHGKIIEDIDAKQLLSRGGKSVRVVTGYGRTQSPKGASEVEVSTDEQNQTVISFVWTRDPSELQQWLAGVKQLIDIEITEYNLEGAFRGLYDSEGDASS